MEELQFLNEKDMEYFEEMEEQGEAIIIRLDPEQLISLDLSELFDSNSNNSPDLESLKKWITEHGAELKEKAKENKAVAQENQQIEAELDDEPGGEASPDSTAGMNVIPENPEKAKESLVTRLQEVKLNEEQSDIINEAILAGLDEKQLLALLMDGMTAEKMRKMLDIFVSLEAGE